MKFLKIFLAALLAVVAGGILSSIFWFMIFMGFIGTSSSSVTVAPESILKIDLAENITDSPTVNPLSGFDFMSMEATPSLPLFKVLQAIDAAAQDDRIKGIYLRMNGGGGLESAAMEEMRDALENFKQSGKFIYAYNETYSQGAYYLASVADKIYLQKEGSIDWQGMSYTVPFFKGLFDKVGVEYEIFRPTSCKFKSAVEPYFLKKMSPENRRQSDEMMTSIWGVIAETVAQARGFESVEELNRLTDELALSLPEDALKHGMVDGLIYEDEMLALFDEAQVARNDENEFNFVTLGEYAAQLMPDLENLTSPVVAILYAEGAIVDGEGEEDGTIYGNTLAEQLAEVRKNDEIKAVVLRVNSPGGSALASDVVWREMSLLQQQKPLVVSMGSYAASGGYYISAPADVILADRMTLTGSIGVFGAFPVVGEMLDKKLGITFDGVKTNANADFGQGFLFGMVRPTNPTEHKLLMRSVDKVYDSFTSKVSEGRNLSMEHVLEIAGGRVWSGVDALKVGLIDSHGGLKAAIAVAAEKAGLENYRVEEQLSELDLFNSLFSGLGFSVKSHLFENPVIEGLTPYKKALEIYSQQGIVMYLPYHYSFM